MHRAGRSNAGRRSTTAPCRGRSHSRRREAGMPRAPSIRTLRPSGTPILFRALGRRDWNNQDVAGDFAHNISAKPFPSEVGEEFNHTLARVIPRSETAPGLQISPRLRLWPRRHDAEIAAFLQPARAFVAQQGAAYLAGIIARACPDHLEAFGMLVAAEPLRKEGAHAVGNGLRRGAV